jgi:transposase
MFVNPEQVYLYRDVVDFRKSINGLVNVVESELVFDVYTGALFLFCNKAKDKLKILYWDKTGFALWYKRLEKEKFKWPGNVNEQSFELTTQQLDWLLSGYSVQGHQTLAYQSAL